MSERVPTSERGSRSGLRWLLTPRRVVGIVTAYLAAAWLAVYVVDVWLATPLTNVPLWIYLFHESYATEILQWLTLGSAAVLAAHLGGRLRMQGSDRLAGFWLILSAGLALMLIEDAGNPRHALSSHAEVLGLSSFRVNAVLLGLVAAVPLLAVLRYGRHVWPIRPLRSYLLAAFAIYGLAGAVSASGPLWYHRGGAWLDATLFGGRLPVAETIDINHNFLIMDLMVEESVELLGAGLFLAAVLSMAHRLTGVVAGGAERQEAGRTARG